MNGTAQARAAEPAGAAGLASLPLRARKRALTRQAILDAARRLFEERGFDHVTVAEIADAANVSVKTLFVYFRSKEDLAFTDTWLLDLCLDALERRPPGTSPAEAIAQALIAVLRRDEHDVADGIEGFYRGYGDSAALHSRLLRMWEEYEDAINAALAAPSGPPPTPSTRLQAIELVGMLRTLTSSELRAAIAGLPAEDALDYVSSWLRSAARAIGNGPA